MAIKKINYQYVVDYFIKQGYPEHAAKGIAGNLGVESEFSTTARNPTSKMKGLAQWDTKRRADLQKFAKNWKSDPNDPDTQLAFVEYELRSDDYKGVRDKLLSSKNSDEASDVFGREYEKFTPKGKQENPAEIEARRYYSANGTRMPKGTKTATTPATTPAKSTTYTAASTANNAGRALPNNDPITLTPVTNYVPPKKEDAAVATASGQRPVVGVPITQTQGKPDGWKSLESRPSKFQSIASSTMPYMSNIANMNLRPAGVPQPVMDTPTQFGRISLDSERNDVQSDYRNAVLNNNATLDVNTAVRANMASKAQKFQFMNKINEIETNKNVEIGNAQTTANAAINSRNNDKLYATRMLEAERTNAITQQQAANLANASDKFIAQQNTQSQNDLEDRKMKLMYMNDPTGYFKRLADKYEKEQDQPKVDANGVTIKAMGGKLYTAGRMVKNMKPINIKY